MNGSRKKFNDTKKEGKKGLSNQQWHMNGSRKK